MSRYTHGLGVGVSERGGLKVVEHGGGIEGFNTQLAYVPERLIAVVVLSNVNATAPDAMGSQLLDVALGRPAELASERKAVARSPLRRRWACRVGLRWVWRG
jgi:Beta-lactamase